MSDPTSRSPSLTAGQHKSLSEEQEWRYLLAGLMLGDLLSVLTASVTAARLALRPVPGSGVRAIDVTFVLLMLVIFAVMAFAQGLYDPHSLLGGTGEYAAVLRACTYSLVSLILVDFLLPRHVSREWLMLSWALATMLVGVERFTARRIAYRLRRHGYFTTRAIVVGADADSVTIAKQLGHAGSGILVVGFLDDYIPAGTVVSGDLKVLGTPSALEQVTASERIREAIVVPQALPWETLQGLMAEAATPSRLRVHLSAGFYDLLTTSVRLSEHNHVPLLTVNKVRLTPFETVFKTCLDYALAAALSLVFAPAMIVTALWLRSTGSRRVLQRRRVFGRYGKPFDLLSFRSAGPLRSEFVRKLPGLVNVLAGQLSLVGPRPSSDWEAPRATLHKFLAIRPGLTGPWRQVDDPEEQAVLDLYYIRSYTIWLDLQVLFNRMMCRLRALAVSLQESAASPRTLDHYLSLSGRVPGFTRGEEAIALAAASYSLHDDAVIVEIGSFLGASAILLAGPRKLRGSGKVHCVDPFDASGDAFSVPTYREIRDSLPDSLRERFNQNIRRAGLSEWVEVHEGRARDIAAIWTGPVDLLFMDSDQSDAGVREAYRSWAPFLGPGSVIAVHNPQPDFRHKTHDGHRRLVEEVIQPPEYTEIRCIGTTTFARKMR